MLKGKELGKAIDFAINAKIAAGYARSKAEIAREFGMKPPPLVDWVKKGSISKDKLPKLWKYFSDVVGPDHWGLEKCEWPAGLTEENKNVAEPKAAIYEVKAASTAPDQLTDIERDLIAGFHAAPIDTQAFWINQARYYIEAKRDFSSRSEKQ